MDRQPFELSRRDFLKIVACSTVAAALNACSEPESPPPPRQPYRSGQSTIYPRSTVPPRPTFAPEAQISPKERLAAVMRDGIDLPDPIVKAISSVANTYSGPPVRADGQFHRLRQLAFSQTTSDQLITRARAGTLFITPEHPAAIVEIDQLRYWATRPGEERNGFLDIYAAGIVDGLMASYSPHDYLVVAIESGHWSKFPEDKRAEIDRVNEDRIRRHVVNDKGEIKQLHPTIDTGSFSKFKEGGEAREKDATLAVSRLVALKIMQYFPYWIPILSNQEEGYLVQRFSRSISDETNYYIETKDALVPLRYKWEQLAGGLKPLKVPMVRIALHFDATDKLVGGLILPQNANFRDESLQLSYNLATNLQKRVQPFYPEYQNRPRPDRNNNPNDPYVTIDDLAFPEDQKAVSEGRVEDVRGSTNKMLAEIRRDWLAR